MLLYEPCWRFWSSVVDYDGLSVRPNRVDEPTGPRTRTTPVNRVRRTVRWQSCRSSLYCSTFSPLRRFNRGDGWRRAVYIHGNRGLIPGPFPPNPPFLIYLCYVRFRQKRKKFDSRYCVIPLFFQKKVSAKYTSGTVYTQCLCSSYIAFSGVNYELRVNE